MSLGAGAGGMLTGFLSNQREGGKDAGNNQYLSGDQASALQAQQQHSLDLQRSYEDDPTKQVQNNGILSGLYGQGGTLDNTIQQEHQQANQGYQLTPEDHEAYGQASGNIARMFGQSDQSMAQALSDRGLSNSGVAGAAFSGSQGNKMEQLAGAQKQIADARMQNNMQRLAQTRSFLSQLGGQANTAINSEQDRGMAKQNQQNQMQMNKFNMASSMLGKSQDQQNEGLAQQQGTAHGSSLSNAMSGAHQDEMQGMSMAAGMMGAGGMSGAASKRSPNEVA